NLQGTVALPGIAESLSQIERQCVAFETRRASACKFDDRDGRFAKCGGVAWHVGEQVSGPRNVVGRSKNPLEGEAHGIAGLDGDLERREAELIEPPCERPFELRRFLWTPFGKPRKHGQGMAWGVHMAPQSKTRPSSASGSCSSSS